MSERGYGLNTPINQTEIKKELSKLPLITPENIVAAAKLRTSPLNKYFEWDDKKAAHKFRLQQARMLVLSIGHDDNGFFTRDYESVVIDDSRCYLPVDQIRSDQSLITQVLESALKEAVYWKTKHQKYSDFFGSIFAAINETEKTIHRSNKWQKENRPKSQKRTKKK